MGIELLVGDYALLGDGHRQMRNVQVGQAKHVKGFALRVEGDQTRCVGS
jgi:hypothetical protein